MEQKDDDLELRLHELGNIPVPDSLLKNIQDRLGQLTPEWATRQYQLGHKSRNLSDGDRGKNLAMAIGHFLNALHVYTSEAFPIERVEVLYDLGCTSRDLSDLPEKDRLTNLEGAVTRYKEAQNVVREFHLADTWIAKLDQAISECYQQRIQELKHRADVAKAIADVLRLTDQLDSALDNYDQALRLYRLVESRLDEAIVLKDMGDVRCSLQNMDAAMQHYQQALECFKQMNHSHDVATVLQAIGSIAQSRHEDAQASQYYDEALDLFRQVKDDFSEALVLASMGTEIKEVALYQKVGEANLPHMEFRSHQGLTAVLDRPVHNETIVRIPDEATRGTPPLPDGPERESFIPLIGKMIVKRRTWRQWILPTLLALVILLGGGVAASSILWAGISHSPCATAPNQPPLSAHGIGVVKTDLGECIGLSDGTVAFDVDQPGRPDSALKQQAAEELATGNRREAMSLLQQASKQDRSDAEAHIYLEDLRVLNSGQPYITLITGTKITAKDIDLMGQRNDLQGVYVAQQEHNNSCKSSSCTLVRVLIANTGNDANNAKKVGAQIVQAAQFDHTIIGVEGWSLSQDSVNIVSTLSAAQLPMVSSSASSDLLTGISPYFFRISPPDSSQGAVAASYAMNTLHASHIALFADESNAYSSSLVNAFKQHLTGGSFDLETYKVGTYAQNKDLARDSLKAVLSYHPDLIYFAGYPEDAAALFEELQTYQQLAQIPVMGGDALGDLVGDPSQKVAGLDHLVFTDFASPDLWEDQPVQKPPFFQEYAQTFTSGGLQANGINGTGATMLSYDAMQVLLQASQTAKTPLTGASLQQALTNITGSQAFQGVSGRIAFGPDGNPSDKTVLLLKVDKGGAVHILGVSGTFLLSPLPHS